MTRRSARCRSCTRSLAEHGGPEGIRDDALLESALARLQNLLPVASGDLDEPAFAQWLREHVTPRG